MAKAECPKCTLKIEKDESELRQGKEFFCPQCGAYFQVAAIDPVRFALTRTPVDMPANAA